MLVLRFVRCTYECCTSMVRTQVRIYSSYGHRFLRVARRLHVKAFVKHMTRTSNDHMSYVALTSHENNFIAIRSASAAKTDKNHSTCTITKYARKIVTEAYTCNVLHFKTEKLKGISGN